MKFNDIDPSAWEELKPYLDTCLIPLTGLMGFENPGEVTQKLEVLRDIMEWVELPFKGRVVTYPAFHFKWEDSESLSAEINRLCQRVKQSGFKYVILMTADQELGALSISNADLFLCEIYTPQMDVREREASVAKQIQAMWSDLK